jgi:long-subunit fatty acid transport protein
MSRILAIVAVFAVSLAALPAFAQDGRMTVAAFLDTAAGIPRNPTAMLRADTRRLMGEIRTATRTVRAEQDAARSAGRPPRTCMPDRVSMSPDGLLARFNAIPAARRNITVTQAVREWMAEEHPCPA